MSYSPRFPLADITDFSQNVVSSPPSRALRQITLDQAFTKKSSCTTSPASSVSSVNTTFWSPTPNNYNNHHYSYNSNNSNSNNNDDAASDITMPSPVSTRTFKSSPASSCIISPEDRLDPGYTTPERGCKRVRLDPSLSPQTQISTYHSTSRPLQPKQFQSTLTPSKYKQNNNFFNSHDDLLQLRGISSHLGRRALSRKGFSVNKFTSTFASNDQDDVLHCPSMSEDKLWELPFSATFNSASRSANDKQVLAVADGDGFVNMVGLDRNGFHTETRSSFRAHQGNAVFDIKFSPDDTLIGTGSGDKSCNIFTTRTQQHIATLSGHDGTIRQITWDPANMAIVSTGSRDGSICLWDLRTSNETPVNKINNAHSPKARSKPRSAPKSVTSILHLPNRRDLLVSSGSGDGVVRFWDLRKSMSRRVNPPFFDESTEFDNMLCGESHYPHPSFNHHNINMNNNNSASPFIGRPPVTGVTTRAMSSTRSHGISCLTLSEQNGRIYALTTDSLIVAHSTAPGHLNQQEPLQCFSSRNSFRSTSFYVRLGTSPCGRFLISGSSDDKIWIWDTLAPNGDPISLKGHKGEVGIVAWGDQDTIASAGDDCAVRIWRPQQNVNHAYQQGNKSITWKWKGSWNEDDDEEEV